ncbi:LysR family transcriptional regulator [Ktedonosporobacter rubrisoli]|uniref:LysR family transcriptional regulator n=1 Tax=Ktedonosporobacter rubrisoli TaxID=2509675 RepID=A0A4P6JV19_KTERU|nr:LysR family transcriptional regulator [Ktedonosporobacter rubrisoli]QBD79508.1 LysR family transcriptional regulator [Ktedonosporobacter rubrisoli]
MELRHLRYFVAVAEEMNFTRAAQRLQITQPPLTRIIQDLEAELDVKLFARSRGQVTLTPAGETFLNEVYGILAHCEKAVQKAQRVSRGEVGQVQIGFSETVICSMLPDAVRLFGERFPMVHVTLRNMTALPVRAHVRAIQERRLDLGVAAFPPPEPDISCECVLRCPLMIALAANHPLAGKEIIELSALSAENWIWFPRHLNPAYYDLCLRLCQQAGFEPRTVQQVASVHVGLSQVAAGNGIALACAALQCIKWEGVVYRHIRPLAYLDFYMMWRSEEASSSILSFVQTLREVSAQHVISTE